ncbi:MAG TPA: Rieske 2Fe-2S domain-containing protein [Solirubrobacterales bacterium]|nr:Rieske 2Fe-2S domain-containing protein [Solirubrobacterales bacterium]
MTRLCDAADVPLGEGRVVRVNGRPLALFRLPAGWYAVQAECPHLGGPLADGIAGERSVICPLHERRFDLLSGEPLGHECEALKTYPVGEREGAVFLLTPEPSEPSSRPTEVPAHGFQESP